MAMPTGEATVKMGPTAGRGGTGSEASVTVPTPVPMSVTYDEQIQVTEVYRTRNVIAFL